MKKITRAHMERPERRSRRVLQLSHETVRVLSSTDMARAAGGSGCTSTSYTTETHTENDGGGAQS